MPLISKFALNENVAVSTLLFARFSIAGLLLWTYIFLRKVPYKTSIKTSLYIICISLIGFTIASVSIYNAYNHLSTGIATLILFTHPIFVIIFESIQAKQWVNKQKRIAALMILVGLSLVLYQKNMSLSIIGIVLSFTSSIAYAVFSFGLAKKSVQKLNGIVIAAYMSSVTAVTMGIQCLITSAPLYPSQSTGWISAILLALVSTVVASVAFYEGLTVVGPSSATLISSFEPLFVIILGLLFLNEPFSIKIIIGGIIIIYGIYFTVKKKPTS